MCLSLVVSLCFFSTRLDLEFDSALRLTCTCSRPQPPSENLQRGSGGGGGAAETCRETRSPSRVRTDGNKLFSLVVLTFFFFFRLSEEIYGRGERGQEVSRREGGWRTGRTGSDGGRRLAAESPGGGNPKKKKTKHVDISGGGCGSVH